MKLPFLLSLAFALPLLAAPAERLAIGEFTATKFTVAPQIDGKIAPGEWERAFTTSGLIAPFEHQLQSAETTMSLGYDATRLYFLFRCRRAAGEWRLPKAMRENDSYEYSDPSVEIWVTPPAAVPETYQNIVNTYPAVFDAKMIPSRGYTAMGWKADWKLGVSENADEYLIEASAPIKDFGAESIKSGDVWRFLLARTAHGAKPRPQASWSITQGFAEIPGHPPVRFEDDAPVVQLLDVTSVFTGQYRFPLAVVAPRAAGAEIEVELRFHAQPTPGEGDRIEKQTFKLAAGERREFAFAGEVGAAKKGYFTITARRADGAAIFRQSFPYEVNGWTPQTPVRPAAAPPDEPLRIRALFGPETGTVLATADVLDLPGKENIASATLRVVDIASGKTIGEASFGPFRESYATARTLVPLTQVPVLDFVKLNKAKETRAATEKANEAKIKAGKTPDALPELPTVTPKKVSVVVTINGKDGKPLQSAAKELELLRYNAAWMNHDIGISEKVIPPWTPVTFKNGALGVWNRSLDLDGLGLARKLTNGGRTQLSSMRAVAVIGGKEITLNAPPGTLQRWVENAADFAGTAQSGDLKVAARTRVEFDGFVRNEWTIGPAGAAPLKIDRLELVVTMPEAEATHFCASSGGWAAIHDETPARWTSQTSANGMLAGDFVPYIWLTDSERAFLWFADSDKGWIHEAAKALPTQEITRANGLVTLRVRFIEIPATLDKPTSFVWGWQSFPSRPLPAGWRATFCAQTPPVPHTKNTYFWSDADWAVLWPYYSSPYPWSMDKSREVLLRTPTDSSHRPSVGSIAHSIGRYRDYDGNQFPGLAVDWGATPGQIGNSDVTASRGPNDFRLWHYQKWVREAGFRSLYVDENYLALEENFLTGNAYYRADGGLQRAYNYLGLREYFKRLKSMFHQNGAAAPNLWQHVSSGAAYHSWFGDVFYEGENVEPTDLQADYMEVLPAGRLRAIGSSVCAGGVMTMMAQAERHKTVHFAKHNHQFVGWCLAHDVMPEAQGNNWPWLCEVARLYEPDVQFHAYWKAATPAKTANPACLVSLHRASDRVIFWVVNTSREDQNVAVTVNFAALGLDPRRVVACDAESGAPIELQPRGFTVPVEKRDYRPVLIMQRGALSSDETFIATFENNTEADVARGSNALRTASGAAPARVARDGGTAVAVGRDGVLLYPFLNLNEAKGRLTFDGRLTDAARGRLLLLGKDVSLQLRGAKSEELLLGFGSGKDAVQVATAAPGAGWHRFAIAWNGGKLSLAIDDKPAAVLSAHLSFKGAAVVFSDALVAIDNVRCFAE